MVSVLGIIAYAVLAHQTLEQVKVNGPYYEAIQKDQALINNVAPPNMSTM